tara:strand:+ start:17 stop:595 length:579 start_codon:yes stop_codon:yes gene_type:complete
MSAFTKFITRANKDGIINQPFIGRDFSQFDQAKMGQLPIAPGYNQEMNIDDTGNITLGSYLKELQNMAGDGIESIADRGMSLFDDSQRSNLTRAGLGALLFGFNPLTAILGAAVGKNLPGIASSFQQSKFNPLKYVQEKRAEREAAARAEFDRLNAIRQQRDADSMSGGPGETTQGTFGSSVNDPSTFSDYS